MTSPELLSEIAAEADRIRSDTLPAGFEQEVAARFAAIAADPAALERQASRADSGLAGRLKGGVSRRARRLVGPPVRSLQRRSYETMLETRDTALTWRLSARERASALSRGAGRFPRRLLGAPQRRPGGPSAPALSTGESGRLKDGVIYDFIISSLTGLPAGEVVVLEEGDGSLGRSLATRLTLAPQQSGGGPFAHLASKRPSSLAAVILSGPDLDGRRARLLTRLVASRLAPGGRLLVVSDDPTWRQEEDPVGSDLGSARLLASATWLYLASSAGLEGSAAAPAADGSAYAVAARRPS